ncbi:MAG: hypothetical protein MK081_04285 [Flavobacteriales bacterium]|nr:hypothetical protein [Flavobacteriales bacterium]
MKRTIFIYIGAIFLGFVLGASLETSFFPISVKDGASSSVPGHVFEEIADTRSLAIMLCCSGTLFIASLIDLIQSGWKSVAGAVVNFVCAAFFLWAYFRTTFQSAQLTYIAEQRVSEFDTYMITSDFVESSYLVPVFITVASVALLTLFRYMGKVLAEERKEQQA